MKCHLLVWMTLLVILAAGCTSAAGSDPTPTLTEQDAIPSALGISDFGPAPELTNTVWLNTDQPLRLEDLRGKVVLIDMWTFG
jgi:hypothetical protein